MIVLFVENIIVVRAALAMSSVSVCRAAGLDSHPISSHYLPVPAPATASLAPTFLPLHYRPHRSSW
jgi:hypothetical protein